MSQLSKDLSADKVKLIYEFNKNSPLFTRVASAEIDQGNFLRAIEILNKGLETHSDYPTAFFLHGLALAYSGEIEKARVSVNHGAELLNSSSTLDFYHEKIEKIIKERDSVPETKRPDFSQEEFPPELEINEEEKNEKDDSVKEELEEYLDELAEKISQAKIKYDPNATEISEEEIHEEYKGKKIVSDTMAGIYLNQGKYQETLETYEELLKIKPDMRQQYEEKIREIKNLIHPSSSDDPS